MKARISAFLTGLRRTLYLMVGMPDYDLYVAHLKARHPGQPIPDRKSFARDCVKRRYEGNGQPNRCC